MIEEILDAACPWLAGDAREAIARGLAKSGYAIVGADSLEGMRERAAAVCDRYFAYGLSRRIRELPTEEGKP